MFSWFEQLVSPFPQEQVKTPPKSFWAFAWACTKGMRPYLAAMTLLTALLGVFEAMLFAMMGKVVDWLGSTPPELFWGLEKKNLLLLAGVLLASTVLLGIQTLIKHQSLAGNFPMRMRWNFHRLMLDQSMSFYQDEFAGRVSAKVMQTALAVRDVWFIAGEIMVFVTIYFTTMILVVGNFNPLVIVPLLVWLTLYSSALIYFVPKLSKVSQAQADARSLMTGRITDAYTNISTVKLFSHAGREADYARGSMTDFLGTVHRQMRLVSTIETINHLLNMLLIIGSSTLGLWLWSKGEMSVGGVAAVAAMALRLNGISHWVMWEMTSLYEQVGTVQDGINTLSVMHSVVDAPEAKPLMVNKGHVQFNQVSFSYPEQAQVLENFQLDIKPGEKIGLVGRSGAGKSTAVNLLLRFYEVQAGKVLIDQQDNIMYGRPDATEDEMIVAAKRAEAHAFILTLKDAKGRVGYDAHVGERGVKLSGGQRQRIAIARVMLKDAPILLLDEATSALDSEVEAVIQDSLYQLMEGKTVVAIAHRLSTIAAMDRLIVLDEGRIVEEGSHHTLLNKGGLYASFWEHQSGGFLGDE